MTRTVLLAVCVSAAASAGASAQTRAWPSENAPRPLPARPVNFPPYEIRTLPNGLKVVLVSHHEQPAVSVRLIVRAGAAQDPKNKLGVAMLTAALLDQGAAGRSAEQIADAIDFIGGILGTGAGTDLTYVNTVVMKDSYALGLQLMADVVRRPNFAQEEVERQRQQAMSALKVSVEDPDNVASQVIDRLIYGFHPYGLPGNGTPESLASLTRQDVVDFHRTFFVPNNALLAIVGDIGPDEAMAGVQKAFGDWAAHDVPPFAPIDPPAPTKRVVIIDKPDAVQTEIRVGHLGIPRKHNDYVAMDQLVKILGGEGANRLQQVLRSQRSLTYGASADLDTYKTAGGIIAETDTRSSATAETLRVIVDEFMRLQRERVYDGELGGAQAYMVGHFPLTIETPDAIATQVLNQLFYELPLDELQTYRERVQRVTPDDIQRVARAYLKPERLSVVLVGNAKAFVNELRGAGFGEYEIIPIEQVDLLAADFKRSKPIPSRGGARFQPVAFQSARVARYQQTSSADVAITPEAKAQAEQLVKKAVEARGGLAALQGVKNLVAEAETSLMTPSGRIAARTKTYFEYPERIRVDAKLPDAEITQVYADGKGWLKDPGGVHDVPAEMLEEFRASARRDPTALLVAAATGRVHAKLIGEAAHEGRALKVVELTGEGRSPVRLHLDPQSGAIVKMTYEVRAPGSQPASTEEVFSDYRNVGGLTIPFKASVLRGQLVMLERTFTDLKINTSIPAEVFTRPQ